MKSLILAVAVASTSFAQTPVTFSAPISNLPFSLTFHAFSSIQVADFNGDGNLDVVAANHVDVGAVFLGDGQGHFGSLIRVPPISPLIIDEIAIGDFNGDGILDLAATCYRTDKVQVFIGNGDGTFSVGQRIVLPFQQNRIQQTALAIADVTGDGIPDIIAAYPGASDDPRPEDYGIAVVPGVGNGTFGKPYDLALGTYSIAAADVNGDGIVDLVGAPQIELLGKGGGAFSFNQFLFGDRAPFIFTSDVNHDGRVDVITLGANGHSLAVNSGNGDGTFQPTALYPLQGVGVAGLMQDFNSDGNLDFAVLMADNTIHMALGNGDGTFTVRRENSLPSAVSAFASGDFNGDGKPDLAFATITQENPDRYTIAIVLNTTP